MGPFADNRRHANPQRLTFVCRLKLGEAFIDCSEDFATEFCEKRQEKLQAQMDAITSEETRILERQKELKKQLYGRFGAAINLEE